MKVPADLYTRSLRVYRGLAGLGGLTRATLGGATDKGGVADVRSENPMRRLRIAGLIGVAAIAAAHVPPACAADAELIAAARKEGRVTWYTTQIVDQLVRPAAERIASTGLFTSSAVA